MYMQLEKMMDESIMYHKYHIPTPDALVLAVRPLDKPSPYVTAAYSIVSRDDMNIAVKRLADFRE